MVSNCYNKFSKIKNLKKLKKNLKKLKKNLKKLKKT